MFICLLFYDIEIYAVISFNILRKHDIEATWELWRRSASDIHLFLSLLLYLIYPIYLYIYLYISLYKWDIDVIKILFIKETVR